MMSVHNFIRIAILVLGISLPVSALAQTGGIEGLWYNQEKTAKIKIYKAKNDKYYGKIDWLEEPVKNGEPAVDDSNPDKNKRTVPLIGLVILKGFEKTVTDKYEEGSVY